MLFKKRSNFYSDNNKEQITKLCSQNAEIDILHNLVHIIKTVVKRIKESISISFVASSVDRKKVCSPLYGPLTEKITFIYLSNLP